MRWEPHRSMRWLAQRKSQRGVATFSIAAAVTLFAAGLRAQISSAPTPQVLAMLDGRPILEDQLPANLQAQLVRMLQQVYLVRLRGLHEVIDPQLLADEAKRRGFAPDQLIRMESAQVPEPSDEEVQAYYEAHKDAIHESLDQSRESIRTNLKQIANQRAGRVYMQTLLQKALSNGDLSILIQPPKIDETPDPHRVKGDRLAPVTIVEFSDFACPFCQRAEATMNALLRKYPGKLRLGYRDFPLEQMHPRAELAAEAANCAAEQGSFWPYHDLLFAHQTEQSREDLLSYARRLALDGNSFTKCLDSARYRQQVHEDVEMGMRGGVIATPGFFINGIFVNGAQPLSVFEQVIDRALASAHSHSSPGAMAALDLP